LAQGIRPSVHGTALSLEMTLLARWRGIQVFIGVLFDTIVRETITTF
jgi:hypothetical protein